MMQSEENSLLSHVCIPITIKTFVFMSSISDQTSFCASLTCNLCVMYVCSVYINHLHLEACFLLMKFSLSSLSISIHQKNIFYQKTNMLKLRKFSTNNTELNFACWGRGDIMIQWTFSLSLFVVLPKAIWEAPEETSGISRRQFLCLTSHDTQNKFVNRECWWRPTVPPFCTTVSLINIPVFSCLVQKIFHSFFIFKQSLCHLRCLSVQNLWQSGYWPTQKKTAENSKLENQPLYSQPHCPHWIFSNAPNAAPSLQPLGAGYGANDLLHRTAVTLITESHKKTGWSLLAYPCLHLKYLTVGITTVVGILTARYFFISSV